MSSSRGSIRRGDLKFCPETSDLLYPRVDKLRKVLKVGAVCAYVSDLKETSLCTLVIFFFA